MADQGFQVSKSQQLDNETTEASVFLDSDKGKRSTESTQNLEKEFYGFPISCLVLETHDELGSEENGSCIIGEIGPKKEEYPSIAEELEPKNVERPIKRWEDGNNLLCLVILLGGKGVRVSTPFINAFPWLPFSRSKPLHLSPPPFNTTTLIKPMNQEEEEDPLDDLRIRRNYLARERHVAQFEGQCVVDASGWATKRVACINVQITVDASRRATQRVALSDA
jgi:hypothetical protein